VSVRILVLPPVPALLPMYAGAEDAVPELRKACREAVAWLVEAGVDSVGVLSARDDGPVGTGLMERTLGERVATTLLEEAGFGGAIKVGDPSEHLVVMSNGSARRSERAPGYLDDRAPAFDDAIERALGAGDGEALRNIDLALAEELMASGAQVLQALGAMDHAVAAARLLYADDPYGVRYWVATWECPS
jgi:hypothetical protein